MAESSVGNRDRRSPQTVSREFDQLLGIGHFAEVGLERLNSRAILTRFLFKLRSGIVTAVIVEHHIGSGPREKTDGGGPNAARAASYKSRFACQRNHDSPRK